MSNSEVTLPGAHLVIGASGQVGGAILNELTRCDLSCFGTYNKSLPPAASLLHLDLGQPDEITAMVAKIEPSCIYLPASYTNVDGCETDPELSYNINVQSVKIIAAAAQTIGARLIYFSSDYVFDGLSGPYSEDDVISPVSVYGRHKVLAEEAVLKQGKETGLIIRTTVVFGPDWQKKNFVLRLIKSLADGAEIPVPDDQIGSPTFNTALAETVVELVLGGHQGIFNVVGESLCSRYELALAVAEEFGFDQGLLVPVATSMLSQKAKRPLKAGLKVDKVRAVLGQGAKLTGYRQALSELHASVLSQDEQD